MKTVKRKKTRAKSRTKARPALSHTGFNAFNRIGPFFAAIGYILAVIILFDFSAFQFALHLHGNSSLSGSEWMIPAANAQAPPSTALVTVGRPVRLKIPSIRVNALITSVGLMKDGSMGVPKLPRDTAWYKLGPKPGQIGSAVIAGHVNWWYGAKGVFEKLKSVKKGDLITVQDDQGVITTFIVRDIREFGLKEDASSVFRSYDGKAHLNLVTCTGIWNRIARVYSKRLVVFADKVEE